MIKLLANFFCNLGEQSNLQVSTEKCYKTSNLIILIFQEHIMNKVTCGYLHQ